MKKSIKPKQEVKAEVSRIVTKQENGVVVSGYIEINVKYGNQWKRIYFGLPKTEIT